MLFLDNKYYHCYCYCYLLIILLFKLSTPVSRQNRNRDICFLGSVVRWWPYKRPEQSPDWSLSKSSSDDFANCTSPTDDITTCHTTISDDITRCYPAKSDDITSHCSTTVYTTGLNCISLIIFFIMKHVITKLIPRDGPKTFWVETETKTET